MLGRIMQSENMNTLQAALQAASLRHRVISDNIANVNTPGFKRSEVRFESLLAEKLKEPEGNQLALVRTNPKHLPLPMPDAPVVPTIERIDSTTMRTDGNNVDIDTEMAGMAKNTIYYNAAAKRLGDYFTGLKSVISAK